MLWLVVLLAVNTLNEKANDRCALQYAVCQTKCEAVSSIKNYMDCQRKCDLDVELCYATVQETMNEQS